MLDANNGSDTTLMEMFQSALWAQQIAAILAHPSCTIRGRTAGLFYGAPPPCNGGKAGFLCGAPQYCDGGTVGLLHGALLSHDGGIVGFIYGAPPSRGGRTVGLLHGTPTSHYEGTAHLLYGSPPSRDSRTTGLLYEAPLSRPPPRAHKIDTTAVLRPKQLQNSKCNTEFKKYSQENNIINMQQLQVVEHPILCNYASISE